MTMMDPPRSPKAPRTRALAQVGLGRTSKLQGCADAVSATGLAKGGSEASPCDWAGEGDHGQIKSPFIFKLEALKCEMRACNYDSKMKVQHHPKKIYS